MPSIKGEVMKVNADKTKEVLELVGFFVLLGIFVILELSAKKLELVLANMFG